MLARKAKGILLAIGLLLGGWIGYIFFGLLYMLGAAFTILLFLASMFLVVSILKLMYGIFITYPVYVLACVVVVVLIKYAGAVNNMLAIKGMKK